MLMEFILRLILDILFGIECTLYDPPKEFFAEDECPPPVFTAPLPLYALYWVARYFVEFVVFVGGSYLDLHEYVWWTGHIFAKHCALSAFSVFLYLYHEYNEWEFNIDFYIKLYAQLYPYQVSVESTSILSPHRFSIIDEAYHPVFPWYPAFSSGGPAQYRYSATNCPLTYLNPPRSVFKDPPSMTSFMQTTSTPKPAAVVGVQFEIDPGFVRKPFSDKSFYDDFWGLSQKAAKATRDWVIGWGPGTLPPVDKVRHAKAVNKKVKAMEDSLLNPVEVDVDSLSTGYSNPDLLYFFISFSYSIFLLYCVRMFVCNYRYPLWIVYSKTLGRVFWW